MNERVDPAISLDTWASFFDSFNYGGISYPFQLQQTLQGNREEIGAGFAGYVRGAYKSNGVVFACMLLRLAVFSEARFQFRRIVKGRPGELFGTSGAVYENSRGGSSSSSPNLHEQRRTNSNGLCLTPLDAPNAMPIPRRENGSERRGADTTAS